MNITVDSLTAASWEWAGSAVHEEHRGWTRDEIETVVERVNRGARLMDREKPGWRESIVPEQLDMCSVNFCIIGQAYGEYNEYVKMPFGLGANEPVNDEAIHHGFLTEIHGERIPFALLDLVWVYLLTWKAEALALPPQLPRNAMLQTLADANLLAV